MNSKNTVIWFVLAASLFAFTFFFERHLHSPAPGPENILSNLKPGEVTGVQISPVGAFEILASRTNGAWLLTKPIIYPAQPAAIEMLLDALQKLTPATRISAGELRERRTADADFGFDNPQFSIVIEAGDQQWQLKVGNKTAPGDQVFLRVVGVDGAFVADADWLKFIPHSADEWRNTALVDSDSFDWIVLTNATKVIELRRDATNHLWRMIRPLSARADSERIETALQQLQGARVSQFITDDSKADLTSFGLQPADLDLWLGRGTNFLAAVHAGKILTNDSTQVFVQREGWNAIVMTAKEPLSPWHGAVNDFRDPHLLELTAPVAEIEVHGAENYTLQKNDANAWTIAGEKFPADAESVQELVKLLAGLRIADFVNDVVTAPDFKTYGLATNFSRQIILRSTAGDTNAVIAQLFFGTTNTNEVFVRLAGEDFIYGVALADFNRVPEFGWEFRDRRIWNFNETNVVEITLHQNGKTRQLVHDGPNEWSFAPGSQGILNNPPAIEETTHRLGDLVAAGWVGRNITQPEKYGLNTNNLSITFELKNGEKHSVDFGAAIGDQTALASVTLEGERWAFVFPPTLYQFVLSYLLIPANVP
jgi:Domain of unknown function (DUF4340)